jgi:hypothetical protein
MMAVGQRVLASQAGRWEVVAPAIGDLFGPGVQYVTPEHVLGACHLRGVKITAAILKDMVLGIDPSPAGKRRTHGVVIDAEHKPGPFRCTFSVR